MEVYCRAEGEAGLLSSEDTMEKWEAYIHLTPYVTDLLLLLKMIWGVTGHSSFLGSLQIILNFSSAYFCTKNTYLQDVCIPE